MRHIRNSLIALSLLAATLTPLVATTPLAVAQNKDPVTQQEVKKTSVVDYINDAYRWAAIFGGLLAVLMLIYAGYRYMTSYGDPEAISDAKDIVEKSLIGLALLILAAVILQTINPKTVDPCKPGEPGCGEIDFTKPKGK